MNQVQQKAVINKHSQKLQSKYSIIIYVFM